MPILFPDTNDDINALSSIVTTICDFWNEYAYEEYGFYAFTNNEKIRQISDEGDRILSAFFPDEPGAFKRVATLLVLARLSPVFFLGHNKPGNPPQFVPYQESETWLPRISFLLVEPAFDHLEVFNEKANSYLPLNGWSGFPSVHSRAEFFLWLEWLRDYDAKDLNIDENLVRRGRMVLATSLILESVYYQGSPNAPILGICDHHMDFTCATYDAILWDKVKAKAK